MTIVKLDFKPGINREATSFSEQGSWYDCNYVRFRSGRPEKIGGWVKSTNNLFKGIARAMLNWTLLDSKDCLGIGTNKKMYIEESGVFNDITPIRLSETRANPITSGAAGTNVHTYTTTAPHGAAAGDYVTISGSANVDSICTSTATNPFTTTAIGSNIVRVTFSTPHYASAGQTVTFSGSGAVGGIPAGDFNTSLTIVDVIDANSFFVATASNATSVATGGGAVTAVFLARLNREFEILSVPTTTTFTFRTDTNCVTGGITGGGAAVTAAFQISIGFSINIVGGGWGTGTWSRGTWSSPVTSSISGISMRIWSMDNYGEDLVFCTRDGPLYYWDASSGLSARGVLVSSLGGASDVPAQVSIVRVTDERHVLAIGCTDRITTQFDPLLIRWCNQEDVANWTPAVTNTSGEQRIPLGSFVVAAIVSRQETLIWTDSSLHSLQYSGQPFTFSLQTVAENTNIISPNAAVNVNNVTYWMGKTNFWVYSGRATTMPCSVERYVFDDFSFSQGAQVYALANDSFKEVTWYYCSANATKPDRYVTYNHEENLWSYGTLGRTAAVFCAGRGSYPFACDNGASDDGVLYTHEAGYDDGSTNPPTAIPAYIESADISIADGDKLVFADQVFPDMTFARSTSSNPSVSLTVQGKRFSGDAVMQADSRSVAKTTTVDQFTKQVWVRIRGRQLRIRVSSDSLGTSWLLGSIRVNLRQDGKY